jgi:phospholipase C
MIWARRRRYADHASVVKVIERNWRLKPLTRRSRENLPNQIHRHDAHVPDNMPAVSDLFDMFDFDRDHDGDDD